MHRTYASSFILVDVASYHVVRRRNAFYVAISHDLWTVRPTEEDAWLVTADTAIDVRVIETDQPRLNAGNAAQVMRIFSLAKPLSVS